MVKMLLETIPHTAALGGQVEDVVERGAALGPLVLIAGDQGPILQSAQLVVGPRVTPWNIRINFAMVS